MENQREANLKEQSDVWTKEKQMEHHPRRSVRVRRRQHLHLVLLEAMRRRHFWITRGASRL